MKKNKRVAQWKVHPCAIFCKTSTKSQELTTTIVFILYLYLKLVSRYFSSAILHNINNIENSKSRKTLTIKQFYHEKFSQLLSLRFYFPIVALKLLHFFYLQQINDLGPTVDCLEHFSLTFCATTIRHKTTILRRKEEMPSLSLRVSSAILVERPKVV